MHLIAISWDRSCVRSSVTVLVHGVFEKMTPLLNFRTGALSCTFCTRFNAVDLVFNSRSYIFVA